MQQPSDTNPTILKAGKLSLDALQRLLHGIRKSPRVVVGSGIGSDAAVIDFAEKTDRLLVAKTDPITFATDRIGWYAVHINANDIVCMGGEPAWFLATILVPTGSEEGLVATIFDQIQQACDSLEVALVGGHTEVALGIERPLVIGCMLGEVARSSLICPESASVGDLLVLTHRIAIEGTAVLAREIPCKLRDAGVSQDIIERAGRMLDDPGISVVPAGRALRGMEALHALHDPTEGGLATALSEMASAAGLGVRLLSEGVAIFPETRYICEALDLDPLGLLASGSLLAAVSPSGISAVTERLDDAGIPSAVIGELIPPDEGLICTSAEGDQPLSTFERDELARYLES